MIQIVFQNENFVVCLKPALVLSVPSRDKNDKRPCLGLQLQDQLGQQIFPVHRLDFEVSGLILYATNGRSHQAAQDWFLKKSIRKLYRAQTGAQNFAHWPESVNTDRSVIDCRSGQFFYWKTKILRGKRRSYESEIGEWSETEAEIISTQNEFISWHLYPITGKPHQLRFELSRHGFPIVGDKLYGSKFSKTEPGIALKAFELDLSRIEDRRGLPKKISI
jgi:tRNA pseudouridine32 synthase/23S rRNA pseudouridine746 synthase